MIRAFAALLLLLPAQVPAAGSSTLRVTGSDGRPVARAPVRILGVTQPGLAPRLSRVVDRLTGTDGTVDLSDSDSRTQDTPTAPRAIRFLVDDVQHAPVCGASQASESVRVTLTPGRAWHGWASPTEATGAPPGEGTVEVYCPCAFGETLFAVRKGTLTAAGEFSVPALPEGELFYRVVAGRAIARGRLPEGPLPDRVALVPAVELKGDVMTAPGKPVAEAEIRMRSAIAPLLNRKVVTNAKGEFRFASIPADVKNGLEASKKGYLPAAVTVSDPSKRVRIFLSFAAQITGRLVPPRGADAMLSGRVFAEQLTSLGALPSELSSELDPAGKFRIVGVPPGRYRVTALPSNYASLSVDVEVKASHLDLGDLLLSSGSTVKVRLLDGETSEPIARPRLVFESNDPRGFELAEIERGPKEVTGLADGTVTVSGLKAGLYRFALNSPPYARTSLPPVELASDTETVELPDVAVSRGARVRVKISGSGGQPVPAETVRLVRGPAISPVRPVSSRTDSEGIASFDRLGEGKYRFWVGSGRPRAIRTFQVRRGESELLVEVSLGGVSVDAQIAGPTGPIEGATVEFFTQGALEWTGETPTTLTVIGEDSRSSQVVLSGISDGRASATEIEPGHYRAEGVPAGPGLMRASLDGTTVLKPVDFGPDGETRLQILLGDRTLTGLVREEGSATPVAGARVETALPDGSTVSTRSEPDGAYRLGALAQGVPLKVQASRADYQPAARSVEASSSVADFVLKPRGLAELSVSVWKPDRTPVRGAQVTVLGHDASREKRGGVSDETGRAVFRLKPGTYQILVRHPGYPVETSKRFTAAGGGSIEKAVLLENGYHVQLVDRREGDQLEARVRLFRSDGEEIPLWGLDSSALAGGVTDLGILAPGGYRVRLESQKGSVEKSFFVRDEAIEVEIR